MTSATLDARRLVNEIFEEEALVLGGLVRTHKVDEDLVWWVVQHLDTVRTRVLRRLKQAQPPRQEPDPDRPHPAIVQFLERVREDGK